MPSQPFFLITRQRQQLDLAQAAILFHDQTAWQSKNSV
jgi:hypothetical protein